MRHAAARTVAELPNEVHCHAEEGWGNHQTHSRDRRLGKDPPWEEEAAQRTHRNTHDDQNWHHPGSLLPLDVELASQLSQEFESARHEYVEYEPDE
jgi:hypothetical protein